MAEWLGKVEEGESRRSLISVSKDQFWWFILGRYILLQIFVAASFVRSLVINCFKWMSNKDKGKTSSITSMNINEMSKHQQLANSKTAIIRLAQIAITIIIVTG